MKKSLITQINQRWHQQSRYDGVAVDALQSLDEAIFNVLEKPAATNRLEAYRAQAEFNQAVQRLIQRGRLTQGRHQYPIKNYGCWDCCLCMVAADFRQQLYEYGTGKGLPPTPPHFLKVMRSWQILSVLGYLNDIVVDPMAVITRGRVQLLLHEDYGVQGIALAKSPLLRFALQHRDRVTIVANVRGHAIRGDRHTHWIVLDPLGADLVAGLMMRDPAKPRIGRCTYRRLYALCLYTTPRHARGILANAG